MVLNTVLSKEAINGKTYTELSRGTINFANENLSKDSYWKKLIEFYGRFMLTN